MQCPYCKSNESKVNDSRETDYSIRRRRECLNCAKRFTTHETIELPNLNVIKKDGKKEAFDREKLRSGIIKSCEKRPVTLEQIEKVVISIESKLRKSTEVSSKAIGQEVMKHLKKLDKVAYLRFSSVYNEFADVSDFKKELKSLI